MYKCKFLKFDAFENGSSANVVDLVHPGLRGVAQVWDEIPVQLLGNRFGSRFPEPLIQA